MLKFICLFLRLGVAVAGSEKVEWDGEELVVDPA
jgi:hypothetical protein